MARQIELQRTDASLTSGPRFRPAHVLAEGMRVLSNSEVDRLMSTIGCRSPATILSRYHAAKKALQEQFGATVDLVQVDSGAIRIATRLEFLTDHLRLDEGLHLLVVGMGFDLVLRHTTTPRVEHAYILTESRYRSTLDFSAVADIAENLLRLAKMIEQRIDQVPDNVVLFPASFSVSGQFEERRVALGTNSY
jgi:hypothetical protein